MERDQRLPRAWSAVGLEQVREVLRKWAKGAIPLAGCGEGSPEAGRKDGGSSSDRSWWPDPGCTHRVALVESTPRAGKHQGVGRLWK